MIDLEGRVALVTGASRGIGRACALRLATAGADVVVNYLTSRRAALEVAQQIQELGRSAITLKADVSEPEDITTSVDLIEDRFGRLDIIVSNAATGGFRDLSSTTPQHLEAAMRTNVVPVLTWTQAAQKLLEASPHPAKVIALSSHGSQRALPAYGTIGVSKAALESLIRQLAFEFGPRGINFNVVLGGLVETDSTRALPGADLLFRADANKGLVKGRQLSTTDLADAVLFLASPLSDLVQGQVLVVDGGFAIGT